MEEEISDSSESQDVNTEVSTPEATGEEQSENQNSGKPAGYYPVDPRTATPEQVQDRLNYMYRQIKDNDRSLREYRNIASEQAHKIEELMNGFGTVTNYLEDQSLTAHENNIRRQMHEAYEAGDNAKYLDMQEKLQDIKLKKLSKPKPQPQQRQVQQERFPSAMEAANEARLEGEITDSDVTYLESWQGETDQSGRPVRPWAVQKSEDDPEYASAYMEMQAVFTNPKFKNLSFQQKLAELDKRMGTSKPAPAQTVMGGSLTSPNKKSNMKLSPSAEKIAVKTKFGGPGKTDAEHIAAYRKQMEKVQSKGSR